MKITKKNRFDLVYFKCQCGWKIAGYSSRNPPEEEFEKCPMCGSPAMFEISFGQAHGGKTKEEMGFKGE